MGEKTYPRTAGRDASSFGPLKLSKLWRKRAASATISAIPRHGESSLDAHRPFGDAEIDRSVEPPPVFDYQFARSPAPSVASSYRSQLLQQRGLDRADNLQAIVELAEPDDDQLCPPLQLGRPESSDSTFGPGPKPASPGARRSGESGDVEAIEAVRPPVQSDSFRFDFSAVQSPKGAGSVEDTVPDPPVTLSPSHVDGLPAASEAEPQISNAVLFLEDIGTILPPLSTVPVHSPSLNMPGPAPSTVFESPPLVGPPSIKIRASTTQMAPADARPAYYNTTKPTFSLNLVCYRSGAKGCVCSKSTACCGHPSPARTASTLPSRRVHTWYTPTTSSFKKCSGCTRQRCAASSDGTFRSRA